MKEYLDIVDDKGDPTGEIVERSIAHSEGVPHRTAHTWLLRKRNGRTEILLQKRAAIKSFPGCYDISSAGHIPAGDDYVESALRELKEELGVEAKPSDLICCGNRYIVWDDVFFGEPYHDRQYTRVFIMWNDTDEDRFILQKEEVDSVLWMDLEQCIDGVKNSSFENCIAMEELMMIQRTAASAADGSRKGYRNMKLFLTSSPIGIYRSNEPLDYKGFNPANGMVDELRKYWTDYARCLLISAFPDDYATNDRMRNDYEGIVKDTGLSISCMDICDLRNGKEKADILHSYDFIILGGGHVPTENAFFRSIDLPDRFRGYSGIVMGISAGTMNCARIVYAQPELPGEATDPSYERFITGLGLTEYNILPHYNAVKYDVLDGMRLFEDIACTDSIGHTFYAITDGSYLLQTEDGAEIRGEAYRISEGSIIQVSSNEEVLPLKTDLNI